MREQRCSIHSPKHQRTGISNSNGRTPIDEYCNVIAEHWHDLKRFYRKRGADDMEAEDLTQDVALAAYEDLERFDSERELLPWLFGIARNRLRMWCRHNRSHSLPTKQVEDDACSIPDANAVDELESIDQRLTTDMILSEFSEPDAQLLVNNGIFGFTAQECACLMNRPKSGIAKRLSRAKDRFRSLAVDKQFEDWPT